MNKEQQERAKVAEMIKGMTGAQMIETFIRLASVRELTADEVRKNLMSMCRHAFAQGMVSISDNQNPAYTPQMRIDDYFNKPPNRSIN